MRIMAIDYGDAHTGIAISDPTGFLTGTTTTIHSRKAEEVAGEIARLVQEHGVEELVMGYPRNMDGTCLLYTSPSPRDGLLSRMPSSA